MWKPIATTDLRQLILRTTGVTATDAQLGRLSPGFWTRKGRPFRFAARTARLGRSLVMMSSQSGLRIRGREAHSSGTVHLGFLLEGVCDFGPSSGGGGSIGRGQAYVVHDWTSYNLTALESTRGLSIRVPEARLRERGVDLSAHRYRADVRLSLATPLRDFGMAIADAAWAPDPATAIVAERVVEDLVIGLFQEASGRAMDSDELRLGLRRRALTHIQERHRDTALSPQTVALALGVSLRSLQRAFQGSDSTISGTIADRRSETASMLLSATGASAMMIDELARRSGFSSAFELRAAFRARHGMLPGEYRAAVRAGTFLATADAAPTSGATAGATDTGAAIAGPPAPESSS
ncbi:AraC family transcriptional regulator [Plantibacter flavus]|uniref:helix-turn-helix transcriptional regulator n=1 Tax=Plantibacter flavus TaxID=150123 RepID=UPI003F13A925